MPEICGQVAAWLGQLPEPVCLELAATTQGVKVRLYTPPGRGQGVVQAWAALTHQQSRWRRVSGDQVSGFRSGEKHLIPDTGIPDTYVLTTSALLPSLVDVEGDPFLALAGRLLGQVENDRETRLRVWMLGKDMALQERARALAAYSYGTESGVEAGTPNPWGLRLGWLRFWLLAGGAWAALSGAALVPGWVPWPVGILGVLAGGVVFLAAYFGIWRWMQWRSLPKTTLERASEGALLRVAVTLHAPRPQELLLLTGAQVWKRFSGVRYEVSGSRYQVPGEQNLTPDTLTPDTSEWPHIKEFALPLSARELAGWFAPPELGEGSGLIDRAARQDVPAPPPARALVTAPLRVGVAVATGEPLGVDPDGHGVIIGGSRSGKTSFVFQLLQQMLAKGPDAPGLFLVDPHLSLADGFLQMIDELPEPLRAEAMRRVRIISPDQPEVVPLNLLTLPEFAWAGNAIVQAGRRIWDDYWGPRMQAALLGLFRLAHAWNRHHPEHPLGLLHVVFAAFNAEWRHDALAYLAPVDRLGTLALDALLGQMSQNYGNWNQGWVTEVVSPILSKAMALELSPWLFPAMHQARFVDLERWVKERCWIILRLPTGEIGREGARLLAGIFYNVFEAAFRRATTYQPVPFYFVIDETQEIGAGMQLEAMLSEGAKFGARVFVLAQSLSMLRKMEGFEAVVQSLLANTSTQAFFSPDPEDADLIRAILSATVRYGDVTLDVPSLHCWLRARVGGQWQPPTLAKVEPLPRVKDLARVQAVIREVIAQHSEDYAPAEGWQEAVVKAMKGLLPPAVWGLLDPLLGRKKSGEEKGKTDLPVEAGQDRWKLGL
ncbi:MAG: type IV secretory system conjugative DNA transfer family protein [Anaerolineales bacterium]|nr:type IV secretory system conjugative DNA transfer family protein [Anaerolineales bacterium]